MVFAMLFPELCHETEEERSSCPGDDHMIRDAVDQTANLSKRLRIMFAVAPQMKRSSWSMA
jgi:hypothetical protein